MPANGDDRLPFTCLVPDGPGIIDIYDQTAALRMAVVERDAVHELGDDWDVPGAYVLLDRPAADGTITWDGGTYATPQRQAARCVKAAPRTDGLSGLSKPRPARSPWRRCGHDTPALGHQHADRRESHMSDLLRP